MAKISKVFNSKKKIFCFTLDLEEDYGSRVGEFNILKDNEKEIKSLAAALAEFKIPSSCFITTSLLEKYPGLTGILPGLSGDYHCHSHTHNTGEIKESAGVFKKYFGIQPLGYRAPRGILEKGDMETLKNCDFKFSSSIFPSYRPGSFNNFSLPARPFLYENNIFELPFAVVPKVRYIISLSYLKLIGFHNAKLLFSLFGLPNIIVFDSHLHDFIVNEQSFKKLPFKLQLAWGRNKYRGVKIFKDFVSFLKKNGYQSMTMTELYEDLKKDL